MFRNALCSQLRRYAGRFDSSDDSEKDLKRRISGFETRISENEESIATLTDELAALKKGIHRAEPGKRDGASEGPCAGVELCSVISRSLKYVF